MDSPVSARAGATRSFVTAMVAAPQYPSTAIAILAEACYARSCETQIYLLRI